MQDFVPALDMVASSGVLLGKIPVGKNYLAFIQYESTENKELDAYFEDKEGLYAILLLDAKVKASFWTRFTQAEKVIIWGSHFVAMDKDRFWENGSLWEEALRQKEGLPL